MRAAQGVQIGNRRGPPAFAPMILFGWIIICWGQTDDGRIATGQSASGASFESVPSIVNHCGLITCSRPSLLTSFKEVFVPRARICTYVGFDSPPKLNADPSSVAAILTLGAPFESIRRNSTVSGYPVVPSGILTLGSAG